MGVSIALLLSTLCFGQTDSETNGGNKRYHGDGIDNVLQYVPTVAVFGLKAIGVESENTWKKSLAISAASFVMNAGVTYALKHSIHERRPDGTDNRSFPSGHTSIAFCGATTLMHEYYSVSPWIGVAGYAVATTVAVDRVRRNRHRWGDVVAGAAIGVASAEVGRLIGKLVFAKEKKCEDVSLSVSPVGFQFIYNFD